MKNKKNAALIGISAGFLNGLFGSGGGIAAVPLLEKSGIPKKESHATALFMTFCLSAVSAAIYFFEGNFEVSEAAEYIPGGIAGSVCASIFFRKMKPALLRKIFGGLVAFSAGRMLWNLVAEWV